MKDDSLNQHKDICVKEGKDSHNERTSELVSSEIEQMKQNLVVLERELMDSEDVTASDRSLFYRFKSHFDRSPMSFKSMLQFVPGLLFLILTLPASQSSSSRRVSLTALLKLISLTVATMDAVWSSNFLKIHAWEASSSVHSEVLESQSGVCSGIPTTLYAESDDDSLMVSDLDDEENESYTDRVNRLIVQAMGSSSLHEVRGDEIIFTSANFMYFWQKVVSHAVTDAQLREELLDDESSDDDSSTSSEHQDELLDVESSDNDSSSSSTLSDDTIQEDLLDVIVLESQSGKNHVEMLESQSSKPLVSLFDYESKTMLGLLAPLEESLFAYGTILVLPPLEIPFTKNRVVKKLKAIQKFLHLKFSGEEVTTTGYSYIKTLTKHIGEVSYLTQKETIRKCIRLLFGGTECSKEIKNYIENYLFFLFRIAQSINEDGGIMYGLESYLADKVRYVEHSAQQVMARQCKLAEVSEACRVEDMATFVAAKEQRKTTILKEPKKENKKTSVRFSQSNTNLVYEIDDAHKPFYSEVSTFHEVMTEIDQIECIAKMFEGTRPIFKSYNEGFLGHFEIDLLLRYVGFEIAVECKRSVSKSAKNKGRGQLMRNTKMLAIYNARAIGILYTPHGMEIVCDMGDPSVDISSVVGVLENAHNKTILPEFQDVEILESQSSSHDICQVRQFNGYGDKPTEPTPKFRFRTSGASTRDPFEVIEQVDTFESFGAGKIPDAGTQRAYIKKMEQSIRNSQRINFAAGPNVPAYQNPLLNGQADMFVSHPPTPQPVARQAITSTDSAPQEEVSEE